uniref:Uncharacterized protein n=1 Tax=Rhizophora mucronata TaxID=61149 RepID=A0A2P2QU07_RHIMU
MLLVVNLFQAHSPGLFFRQRFTLTGKT